MTGTDKVALKKLAEKVLANDGELPLVLLLEHLAPVVAMRELARDLGLTPKGGFRLDKAPAKVLAQLLAEQREQESLDKVLALLRPVATPPVAGKVDAGRDEAFVELQQLAALRAAELERLRLELERAREAGVRARDREVECERRLQVAAEQQIRLQRMLDERPRAAPEPAAPRDDRALQRRARELEGERDDVLAADEALRRRLAWQQSRLRELEDENAELQALLPGRKRRARPAPPPAETERRVRVPRFLPSFYKSLEGKERRSVERAIEAILLFCTEGHGYPGLEVKQLGGQDTWSLRASLGLRVYFRPIGEGDIELLELGNREDQNTTLRRLKER